jgi:hypothetical protein
MENTMPHVTSGQVVLITFPSGISSPQFNPAPAAENPPFPGGYQFMNTSTPVDLIFRIDSTDYSGYTMSMPTGNLPTWIQATLNGQYELDLTFDFGSSPANGDEYNLTLNFTGPNGEKHSFDPQVGNDGTSDPNAADS